MAARAPASTTAVQPYIRPWGPLGFAQQFTQDPPARINDLRLSAGTDDSGTFRVRHTAMFAAFGIRLVYLNGGSNGTGANNVTIAGCGLEISGTTYRVTFNGSNSVVLRPGLPVISDPVVDTSFGIVSVSAASTFYSRTHYTVSSGGKWQTGHWQNYLTARGEGSNRGTSATDISQNTGTTGLTQTGGEYIPAPIAVIADHPSSLAPMPGVLLCGDSITSGIGDVHQSDEGFSVRAATGAALPHLRSSVSAEQVSQINAATIRRAMREQFYDSYSHAIVLYGSNDIQQSGRTQATIQSDLTTFWTRLYRRGIKVFACTIPPLTTSTDSWATTGNQTASAICAGGDATRIAINNWIRTTPSPLTGYFETADSVESSRNSGKWKVTGVAGAYTGDGIHPSATGHAAMAAAITTASFT